LKPLLIISIKIILIISSCFFAGCQPRDEDAKVNVVNPDYTGSYYDQKKQRVWLWGSDGNLRWSDDGKLWHNLSTETSAAIVDLQKDEASNLIIAVTAEGKILRSKNAGDNWQMVSIAGIKTAKKLIYIAEFKRWFLLGDAGKLWTSTDKGLKWNAIDLPSAFTTSVIESMILTANKKRLLMGGSSGLTGYSDNQGESWNITQLEMETPITGFYLAGDRVIATAAYGKFLTSDASGTQWSLLETDGKAFFTDGIYLPKEDVMLITTHNGNLLRGTPKTNQWQMASLPYRNSLNYLTHIWSDPSGLLRIVGHGGTHLTSSDAGKTWQAQNESSNFYFENIQDNFDSKQKSGTWIGFGRNGLLGTSNDQGKTWNTIFPLLDVYVREALITPKGTWILAGDLGVILRSDNKGKDWQQLAVEYIDPVTPPSYRALVLSLDKQTIFAAGPTGSILRSQDDGKTWQTVFYSIFGQGEAFTDLKIDPTSGKIITLEAWGRHKISVDNGSSWRSLEKHQDERALWQLTLLPKNVDHPGIWLAAGQGGLVSTSLDGETWQMVDVDNLDWFGVYADEINRQLFILGAQGAIYRSKDAGQSWYPFNTPTEADLRRMISVNSEILLAAGGEGVILRSTDKGDSWNKVDSGIKDEIRHLEMDDRGNIYAVAKGGQLLKSQDSGSSWKIIATQTQSGLRDLIIDKEAILVTGQRISVIRK
jgi:photosystem II stability/assembly factor-like uncharacterized protein